MDARETNTAIPPELASLAEEVRSRGYEAAKRLVVAKVGSVARGERFDDDVADAVFLRLQRNAQVGRYAVEAEVMNLGRNARRLEGAGRIRLWRAAPRGAGVRPGDFAAGSREEAGFYCHGGNVVQAATVAREDVLLVDGSMGGGKEYVYLPRGHVPAEPRVHFESFAAFWREARAAVAVPAAVAGPGVATGVSLATR